MYVFHIYYELVCITYAKLNMNPLEFQDSNYSVIIRPSKRMKTWYLNFKYVI